MLKEIEELERRQKMRFEQRTKESVADAILTAMTGHRSVTGNHEPDQGLIKMTREFERNPEFRAHVEGAAEIVMALFPNQENP